MVEAKDGSSSAGSHERLSPTDCLYAVVGLAIGFGLFYIPALWLWSMTPDAIKYPAYYGVRYQIARSHVLVSKKPTDCGWWHAPIGDKGCHYEKFVAVQPENGAPVSYVHVVWVRMQD